MYILIAIIVHIIIYVNKGLILFVFVGSRYKNEPFGVKNNNLELYNT